MAQLVNQSSAAPTRKMSAVAITGFVSALAVAAIRKWAPELDAPGIIEFIPVVVAWVAGYFVRERL